MTPWHSQNQFEIQDILYLGPSRDASSRSRSSVVNDGGDAKQLAHTATPRRTRSFTHSQRSTESTDNVRSLDLSFVGSGVPSGAPGHPETLNFDLTSQGEGHSRDHDHEQNAASPPTAGYDLEHDLRVAFQRSEEGDRREYLPLDQLDRIVTADQVKRELQKYNIVQPGELDHYTNQIWGITKSPNNTSRRKIFAILALLERIGAIPDFIKNDLYDGDLPFEFTSPGRWPSQLLRTRKGGATESITFSQEWPTHLLESFCTYQLRLLAPYFELSTKSQPKVLHYNLKSTTILPFIEVNKENVSAHCGGFGDVWRVKIHPAHHNCCTPSPDNSGNPSFAIKLLRHNDKAAFEAEVSTLKRLGSQDHLHLIKLLVTYSYRDEFYLLFPWADGGNLQDLWKEGYPDPTMPPRDERLAQWLSRQILGVVEGLRMIHDSEIQPSSRGESLKPTDVNRKYGRHGDLKPENILWFKTYHSDDKACFMGLLKISDFGMTSFHASQTRSKLETSSVGMSLTYRAPEYDIKKHVSQKYDIWTLGCILLEFATWYLLGWKGVDSFSKSRADDDNQEVKEDVFFNLEQGQGNGKLGFRARMKKAVADHFDNLRNQPNCPDFILDLLDFIETDLLRMDPGKRATIVDIVRKVKEFHQKCEADIRYCTNRVKKDTTRVRTDLSELEASNLSYSREMQEQFGKTVVTREGDSKADPGSQRELRDLETAPAEAPSSSIQIKRRRTDTPKGKEPERMPTLEEIPAQHSAEHSTHEPQNQISGITVTSAAERDNQPRQSEVATELSAQIEMAHELNRRLHDLPPPRDDDESKDHSSVSTATPRTTQDPIETAETSQPPEVGSAIAEPDKASTSMAESPAVSPRLQSKSHANPSPTGNIHTGDTQDGGYGPHLQGEQRHSDGANARQLGQVAGNIPTGATSLAGNRRFVSLAGSDQAIEMPDADRSTNVSANTAVPVASTGRRTRFREILCPLLCCFPNPSR